MKRSLMVFAWLSIALPAAAEAQQVDSYQAALEARHAGHPEEAARLLHYWLAAHPADADARVNLAYAELALGQLDAAEADFRAVLAKAPDYKDASDGLAIVASRRSATADASHPQMALEGSWSDLDHGARDWYEASGRLTAPVGARASLDASASYYRRFALEDVELAGSVTVKHSDNLWLRAQASVTPNADFRPRWSVGGGFDWRLRAGPSATVLMADARYEDFPSQHVTTLAPGIMRYVAGGRAWFTARGFVVIPQGRDAQFGWMLRGDFQPVERYRVFAGVADGPDTDLGVVTSVTSLFGGIEVPLDDRFALTTSMAREWRSMGSDRTELRLGLKVGL